MHRKRLVGFIFAAILLATPGLAQITVVGTDIFPADVVNVQAAVNNPNTTVYLQGTFNFGPNGWVLIDVPGITLEGVESGATIKGGFAPIRTFKGTLPSGAKNVAIRNINFEGWSSWAIYHVGVQAEDNFTLIEGNTFNNTMWPAANYGNGIYYGTGGGSAEINNNTFINIRALAIATRALTLHPDDHLLISGNKVINCHSDAIVAEAWNVFTGDPENGPVIIRNNEINMGPDLIVPACWAINLGNYYLDHGISNALIEGNIITGSSGSGITALFYGHNRKIINNDLSGLTTWAMQISTWGRDDLIANNVLGPMDTEKAALYGVPFLAAGIVMWSANPNPGVLPDTQPVTNNVSTDNDFRLTGLKGWAYDASNNFTSSGCVLLASVIQFFPGTPWPGCGVTDNLIKETGQYPVGTGGPRQQILEFPVYAHHNRIVGHAANEYAQLEAANPGIGQKIRESGAKFMEMLLQKQAFNKELQKELEEY